MNENNENNPPVNNEISLIVTTIKIVIFALFLIPIAQYTIVSNNNNVEDSTNKTETFNISNLTVDLSESMATTLPKIVKKVIVQQPSCPRSYELVILQNICADVVIKHDLCTPEDIHDQKKHQNPRGAKSRSSKEPQVPTIINYALGGLLITSLGAALIELYKAKTQPSKKDGKNPLSRKCSLADLTVLKHHRKELVRRESILEVLEEGPRLPAFKPPPLHRRCSFPVGPSLPPLDHQRVVPFLEGKPANVIDNRRQSIVIDGKIQSIILDRRTSASPVDSNRRVSVCEDSPERRHHTRLVHRH